MYIQTWHLVCKLPKPILKQIQKYCPHDWSKTEWGHSIGSNFIDQWCRWCNFYTQVPFYEMPETWTKAKKLIVGLPEKGKHCTHSMIREGVTRDICADCGKKLKK